MQTEADKQIEKARESIQGAIESLTSVVLTRTVSGWDDYTDVYQSRMWQALQKLNQVRELLEP